MGFPRDEARARAIASDVLPKIRSLAAAGEREAIFLLGFAYDEGLGVEVDAVEAASWYRPAAEQGDTIPMFRLGAMYEAGRGVPRDLRQAREWYARAAARGLARAREALARLGG